MCSISNTRYSYENRKKFYVLPKDYDSKFMVIKSQLLSGFAENDKLESELWIYSYESDIIDVKSHFDHVIYN